MKARRKIARLAVALVAISASLGLGASAASGAPDGNYWLDPDQFAIEWFTAETSAGQAGGRTDFDNDFEMKNGTLPSGATTNYGRPKSFAFDLPAGLVGNPNAVPTCERDVFLRFLLSESCPTNTRVGTAGVKTVSVGGVDAGFPIVNLEPGADEPALFGINFGSGLYSFIEIDVSPDGDLTAIVDEVPLAAPVYWSEAVMWGVPADENPANPGDWPRVSFMSNPTNCVEPFSTVLHASSYENKHHSMPSTEPARTDCDKVPFEPSMSVTPTADTAGAPTGLQVNIQVPQSQDPDGLATAHVKDVTMTMPEGLILNGSSANGLGSCSPQQFGYHEQTPISCPENSKIGNVVVETPLLDEPLSGPVYVAKQNDNPFNSLLAIYMVPRGPGIELKLAGKVDLDPNTGRITTTFLNNPQQPFSDLKVTLKDGPRAPMSLPRACGTYTATAELSSWSGKSVPLASSFAVDRGCGRENAFTPGFAAGTTNPEAGAFSPFTMRITRGDEAQPNVSRLTAKLPEGLLAKLAGVPLCSDADAAAANCPEASKVGRTTVGVGAGPEPVFAPEPGKSPTALYLAGPYNGGPYSIVAEVPAQAGPFDLGTVVLRNALRVDPTTAQVTAISDPLPQFLQGVPIEYRDIRIDVDRPNFTLNPTDCSPMSTEATIDSIGGQAAKASAGFRAHGCRGLGFKPKLALSFSGQTKRSGNPALKAVMTQPPGQANIGAVEVILPRSSFIDNAHINNPCTRPQFAANQCPPGSILGTATAHTPLLDQPLQGNVYFRANGGERELPDLVAALRGPISIDLVGFIDSVGRKGSEVSRVRSRFALVPDSPVSRFEMKLKGGKVGLIENSANLCARKQIARVNMDGQNGRAADRQVTVKTSCGKARKGKKARRGVSRR